MINTKPDKQDSFKNKVFTEKKLIDNIKNIFLSNGLKKKEKPFFTLSILLLFLIPSLILLIVSKFIFNNHYINQYVNQLFFFGSNKIITLYAGQYWRILTYGIAPSVDSLNDNTDSIIILIIQFAIYGYLFKSIVNTSLKTEINNHYTKRYAISFIFSYVVIGFFTSIIDENFYIGGMVNISFILLGIFLASYYRMIKQENIMAKLLKFDLYKTIFLFIIFTIFFNNDSIFINLIFLVLSTLIGIIFITPKNEWNWNMYFSILVIITILVISVINVIDEHLVPVKNENIINAFALYGKNKVFSWDYINKCITNIKWSNYFDNNGNFLIIK